MKRTYIITGVVVVVLAITASSLALFKGTPKKEISFAQMSEIKSSASTIGIYLGALSACLNDEKLNNALKDPMTKSLIGSIWDPESTLTADVVKSKVVAAMEKSGLDNSDLEKIDDIIREQQVAAQKDASSQISSNFEGGLNFCISIMSQTAVFNKEQVLPEDPVDRINAFAKITLLH